MVNIKINIIYLKVVTLITHDVLLYKIISAMYAHNKKSNTKITSQNGVIRIMLFK